MKRRTIIYALLLAFVLLFTGCNKNSSTKDNNNTTNNPVSLVDEAEMFTERDYETTYDKNNCVKISLNNNSVSCDSDAVSVSGTTITIKDEGAYLISGTLSDGMIVVDANETDKPHIILENASITNSTSCALYILEADKVFVTLKENTSNLLANGGEFQAIDDNNIYGAIFSKQDLTFNGSGKLTVTSPVGHGIVCKDDLVLTGGSLNITSASHGLDANDSVRMTASAVTIDSGKDGIHVENTDETSLGFLYIKDGTYDISSEGDGTSSGAYTQINDGTFTIVSGGGSANATKQTSDSWGGFMGGPMGGHMGGGMGGKRPGSSQNQTTTDSSDSDDSSTSIKAMKAGAALSINGGSFTIDSADDSVHSNASITISGGTFQIASGDDAFHADETLTISGGTIDITKSYEGLEGLHVKVSGGDIKLVASDDGLNAAGGTDSSGTGGPRGGDMFGGRGGMGGMGGNSSSNGSIVISGGKLYVNSSGDGMDANGTLEINGGYTIVVGPTRGDTATLDYDVSATISGGTFIGTGASGMAQTFSDSSQGVIAINAGTQSAGTKITLADSKGNSLISHQPELDFSVVIISSPDVKTNNSYTISVGSASQSITAN